MEAICATGEVDLTLLIPSRWEGPVPDSWPGAPYRLVKRSITFPGHGGGYWFSRGLGTILREFRPEIVHVEEEPWSVVAYQVAFWKKRLPFHYLLFSWENLPKNFGGLRGWMERRSLGALDFALAGNEGAVAELQRKGFSPERVAILPQLGVDPERFKPREGAPSSPWTIGYAGRLVPEKGIDVLLGAASKLEGEFRLKLLGAGPLADDLKALAQRLGVEERTEFLGAVPHGEVAGFFQTLDVLVLPSVTTRQWAEQFGHVIIEAMACALPVVGSRSGAIPEVVGETGLLFPEGDAAALRDCLIRLRDDQGLSRDLGERGRQRVLKRYTWDQIARSTLDVYRQLSDLDKRSLRTPDPLRSP
jgi:glycosyltransferase involved in cell wall biosynthesis